MFEHAGTRVEIVREVDPGRLRWLDPRGLSGRESVGGNNEFYDFSGRSWSEAAEMLAFERDLIGRIEQAADPESEVEEVQDELEEDPGAMLGLDLGVAAAVLALSAAGCVPFASCNGGAFGDWHHEDHPLVMFHARPAHVAALLDAAAVADVGLECWGSGELMVYANDIRRMPEFAAALIADRRRLGQSMSAL